MTPVYRLAPIDAATYAMTRAYNARVHHVSLNVVNQNLHTRAASHYYYTPRRISTAYTGGIPLLRCLDLHTPRIRARRRWRTHFDARHDNTDRKKSAESTIKSCSFNSCTLLSAIFYEFVVIVCICIFVHSWIPAPTVHNLVYNVWILIIMYNVDSFKLFFSTYSVLIN